MCARTDAHTRVHMVYGMIMVRAMCLYAGWQVCVCVREFGGRELFCI